MSLKKVIYWFRQDLRLQDNPALTEAAAKGHVLPIYFLEDLNAGEQAMGEASRWWLHHSLQTLSASLKGKLAIFTGDPTTILLKIALQHEISHVYWNRCYEPWRIQQAIDIKNKLKEHNIKACSYNGSLLWEPWEISKSDGTPYKIFTPFYRKGCLAAQPPRKPLPKPKQLHLLTCQLDTLSLDHLQSTHTENWSKKLKSYWSIGENGANKALQLFLERGIDDYKQGRNFPSQPNVSKLSPHLHFGEISPNQVWHAVRQYNENENTDCFCSELGWREFSYHLLYHFPALPKKNLNARFDAFNWQDNPTRLLSWQQGQTGYPIVDAGMRELWETGYMHNRVRMIAGSFLVKNLLLHWHHGERWFWNCLVDADLANNSASWQWIAGCGADAAPYFRIFNPVTQGQTFDPEGHYTRRYVRELKQLPNKYLFNPWEAPSDLLEKASIRLGQDYPQPIVDLKQSRFQALEAFNLLRSQNS